MTRILILGGGFGGVYAALTLEKLLKAELDRGEVELGLVSRDNYIVFQPMLPEVISGSIGIVDTITPIRRLCPRTNVYTRMIESIDLEAGGWWRRPASARSSSTSSTTTSSSPSAM